MKEKFLNNYFNIVTSNKDYSEEELEKMKYGVEGIYFTIEKLVIILLLSLVLGILKEVIILLLFYNFLRYFGFGFHAKTSTQCLIISTLLFCIIPFLLIKNIICFKYKFIITLICLFNFIIFAPADTKKRPLINKKKRLIWKSLLIISTILLYILSMFITKDISNLIILSIISEMFMTNPLIYIITGQTYNNYKNYKKN